METGGARHLHTTHPVPELHKERHKTARELRWGKRFLILLTPHLGGVFVCGMDIGKSKPLPPVSSSSSVTFIWRRNFVYPQYLLREYSCRSSLGNTSHQMLSRHDDTSKQFPSVDWTLSYTEHRTARQSSTAPKRGRTYTIV